MTCYPHRKLDQVRAVDAEGAEPTPEIWGIGKAFSYSDKVFCDST